VKPGQSIDLVGNAGVQIGTGLKWHSPDRDGDDANSGSRVTNDREPHGQGTARARPGHGQGKVKDCKDQRGQGRVRNGYEM